MRQAIALPPSLSKISPSRKHANSSGSPAARGPTSSSSQNSLQGKVPPAPPPSTREANNELINYLNGIYHGTALAPTYTERHGLGIYAWDSGEVYFGEWKNDVMHGEGVVLFPQGGFLHGIFSKGRLSGAAFLKFANGDIYEGFWRNGKLEGNCYKYFTEKDKWILSDYKNGEFSHVIAKGQGLPPSYVFSHITSTNELAAAHVQNCRQPLQCVNFSDGGQYLGLISRSKPTGLGIFKYSDEKYDVGMYKDGNLHGIGRKHLHSGDVYDGEFFEGQFHGRGVFFQAATGEWIAGTFESNKCVDVIRKGNDGVFPGEIASKYRADAHFKANKLIERGTSLDFFAMPIYNNSPINPDTHKFYLDLSISQSQLLHKKPRNTSTHSSNNINNTKKSSSEYRKSENSSSIPRRLHTNESVASNSNVFERNKSKYSKYSNNTTSNHSRNHSNTLLNLNSNASAIQYLYSNNNNSSSKRIDSNSSFFNTNEKMNSQLFPRNSSNINNRRSNPNIINANFQQSAKLRESREIQSQLPAGPLSQSSSLLMLKNANSQGYLNTSAYRFSASSKNSQHQDRRNELQQYTQQNSQTVNENSVQNQSLHVLRRVDDSKQMNNPEGEATRISDDLLERLRVNNNSNSSGNTYKNSRGNNTNIGKAFGSTIKQRTNSNSNLNVSSTLTRISANNMGNLIPATNNSSGNFFKSSSKKRVPSTHNKALLNMPQQQRHVLNSLKRNHQNQVDAAVLRSLYSQNSRNIISSSLNISDQQQQQQQQQQQLAQYPSFQQISSPTAMIQQSQQQQMNREENIALKVPNSNPAGFVAGIPSSSSVEEMALEKREIQGSNQQIEFTINTMNAAQSSNNDIMVASESENIVLTSEFPAGGNTMSRSCDVQHSGSKLQTAQEVQSNNLQQYLVDQNKFRVPSPLFLQLASARAQQQQLFEENSNSNNNNNYSKRGMSATADNSPLMKVTSTLHSKQAAKNFQQQQMQEESQEQLEDTTVYVVGGKTRKQKSASNSDLDLESLRNEIANFEQMASSQIPERQRRSRMKRDHSYDLSLTSRTPNSVTPTNQQSNQQQHQQHQQSNNNPDHPFFSNLNRQFTSNSLQQNSSSSQFQSQQPLQQQQQQSQQQQNQQEFQSLSPNDQDADLHLEESEFVLDSIKQIKQDMISQLHELESKQNQLPSPTATSINPQLKIGMNRIPSFQIPRDSINLRSLKDNSFESSPQQMADYASFLHNESPGLVKQGSGTSGEHHLNSKSEHASLSQQYQQQLNPQQLQQQQQLSQSQQQSQKYYYTEEEANQIAERIERNLTGESSYYHHSRDLCTDLADDPRRRASPPQQSSQSPQTHDEHLQFHSLRPQQSQYSNYNNVQRSPGPQPSDGGEGMLASTSGIHPILESNITSNSQPSLMITSEQMSLLPSITDQMSNTLMQGSSTAVVPRSLVNNRDANTNSTDQRINPSAEETGEQIATGSMNANKIPLDFNILKFQQECLQEQQQQCMQRLEEQEQILFQLDERTRPINQDVLKQRQSAGNPVEGQGQMYRVQGNEQQQHEFECDEIEEVTELASYSPYDVVNTRNSRDREAGLEEILENQQSEIPMDVFEGEEQLKKTRQKNNSNSMNLKSPSREVKSMVLDVPGHTNNNNEMSTRRSETQIPLSSTAVSDSRFGSSFYTAQTNANNLSNNLNLTTNRMGVSDPRLSQSKSKAPSNQHLHPDVHAMFYSAEVPKIYEYQQDNTQDRDNNNGREESDGVVIVSPANNSIQQSQDYSEITVSDSLMNSQSQLKQQQQQQQKQQQQQSLEPINQESNLLEQMQTIPKSERADSTTNMTSALLLPRQHALLNGSSEALHAQNSKIFSEIDSIVAQIKQKVILSSNNTNEQQQLDVAVPVPAPKNEISYQISQRDIMASPNRTSTSPLRRVPPNYQPPSNLSNPEQQQQQPHDRLFVSFGDVQRQPSIHDSTSVAPIQEQRTGPSRRPPSSAMKLSDTDLAANIQQSKQSNNPTVPSSASSSIQHSPIERLAFNSNYDSINPIATAAVPAATTFTKLSRSTGSLTPPPPIRGNNFPDTLNQIHAQYLIPITQLPQSRTSHTLHAHNPSLTRIFSQSTSPVPVHRIASNSSSASKLISQHQLYNHSLSPSSHSPQPSHTQILRVVNTSSGYSKRVTVTHSAHVIKEVRYPPTSIIMNTSSPNHSSSSFTLENPIQNQYYHRSSPVSYASSPQLRVSHSRNSSNSSNNNNNNNNNSSILSQDHIMNVSAGIPIVGSAVKHSNTSSLQMNLNLSNYKNNSQIVFNRTSNNGFTTSFLANLPPVTAEFAGESNVGTDAVRTSNVIVVPSSTIVSPSPQRRVIQSSSPIQSNNIRPGPHTATITTKIVTTTTTTTTTTTQQSPQLVRAYSSSPNSTPLRRVITQAGISGLRSKQSFDASAAFQAETIPIDERDEGMCSIF